MPPKRSATGACPAPPRRLTAAEIASADTQLDQRVRLLFGRSRATPLVWFLDYGDYRRTYDPIRHQWMYDIGGHGWNETELMPNVWLWSRFCEAAGPTSSARRKR